MNYTLPKLAVDSVASVLSSRGAVDGRSLAARFEPKRAATPAPAPVRRLSSEDAGVLSMAEREFTKNASISQDLFSDVDEVPSAPVRFTGPQSLTDLLL